MGYVVVMDDCIGCKFVSMVDVWIVEYFFCLKGYVCEGKYFFVFLVLLFDM